MHPHYPNKPAPKKLNGGDVVLAMPLPIERGMRDGCVVVVDMGREHVASVHSYGGEGWHQGHYGTLADCMKWALEHHARKVKHALERS